jgi:hypothetical protein
MTDEGTWGPEDVARFLGVPVATLYRWRYTGTGPKPPRWADIFATSGRRSRLAARPPRRDGGMTIEKRGNSWRARYRGPDGRERAKSFRRKVDAEAMEGRTASVRHAGRLETRRRVESRSV